jgi:hypothetical protein
VKQGYMVRLVKDGDEFIVINKRSWVPALPAVKIVL